MAETMTKPIVAKELLWTYRGISEEGVERDFYLALSTIVAEQLSSRFASGERVWVGREMRLKVGVYTLQVRLINIEPPLATVVDERTEFLTQYKEQRKDAGQDISAFIAEIIRYPDERFVATYKSLVGIDDIKRDVIRKLTLLLRPNYLDDWLNNMYGSDQPLALLHVLHDRYPLLILEGEVGSGKTALVRSIGHRLATGLKTEIVLYIVNAQIRGGGHVGELTQNIARTFNEAERCQEQEQIPVIVFIDEADALAQARGGKQTHHEDDAGVNTLIQRIDRLRGHPMAVIFATNFAQALDSAIMRRAIATYHFDRPDDEQRAELFRRLLTDVIAHNLDIAQLVELTKPRSIPGFGAIAHRYTYSDLAQRIIPQAAEDSIYAQKPMSMEFLVAACQSIMPTPERAVAV